MSDGLIVKAISGFYYVRSGDEIFQCKARGLFRLLGTSPMVGDYVIFDAAEEEGRITEILPRKNSFVRPSVANIDLLVILASAVPPVSDPYLIDMITAFCEDMGCGAVICINKEDLDRGDSLAEIYSKTPYPVVRTSAVTGTGIEELRTLLVSKVSAFAGNSGVGKSSVLNALYPNLGLETGEVSKKLGRGRHTTRHVELLYVAENTFIADTPGFASFDNLQIAPMEKRQVHFLFPEFEPFLNKCRFNDCFHNKEPDCAVTEAVGRGEISGSRHASYLVMLEKAK